MASNRKQLNIRIDPTTESAIPLLMERIGAVTGLTVSQSDLFRLGIRKLVAEHFPEGLPIPEVTAPKPSRRKK